MRHGLQGQWSSSDCKDIKLSKESMTHASDRYCNYSTNHLSSCIITGICKDNCMYKLAINGIYHRSILLSFDLIVDLLLSVCKFIAKVILES